MSEVNTLLIVEGNIETANPSWVIILLVYEGEAQKWKKLRTFGMQNTDMYMSPVSVSPSEKKPMSSIEPFQLLLKKQWKGRIKIHPLG